MVFGITAVLVFSFLMISCGSDNANGPDGNPDLTDFVLAFIGMDPHLDQLVEGRIISDQDQLLAYFMINQLELANESLRMSDALPEGDYHLDFFADLNQNGQYDQPADDHAWRVDIPVGGIVNFTHNINFTDISTPTYDAAGERMTINFTNFTQQVGQMFELHVIEAQTERTVGFYRTNSIPSSAFTVSIPQIIEDGVQYQIDFYADRNDNRQYNFPPEDQSWRIMATGTASGINLNFAHNTNFTNLDF